MKLQEKKDGYNRHGIHSEVSSPRNKFKLWLLYHFSLYDPIGQLHRFPINFRACRSSATRLLDIEDALEFIASEFDLTLVNCFTRAAEEAIDGEEVAALSCKEQNAYTQKRDEISPFVEVSNNAIGNDLIEVNKTKASIKSFSKERGIIPRLSF